MSTARAPADRRRPRAAARRRCDRGRRRARRRQGLRGPHRPGARARRASTSRSRPASSCRSSARADAASPRCMRLVADLDEPTAGTSRCSARPRSRRALDQEYGIAFQSAGLLPWRTVAANVALPLELHGVGSAARADARGRAARDGRARRLRRPLPRPALRRHAAARRDRPVARRAAAAAAHGRAVRRARRDDPREDADRARAHLAPRPAPPWCSSPTRSPRRCSSPTAWSSCRRVRAASREIVPMRLGADARRASAPRSSARSARSSTWSPRCARRCTAARPSASGAARGGDALMSAAARRDRAAAAPPAPRRVAAP